MVRSDQRPSSHGLARREFSSNISVCAAETSCHSRSTKISGGDSSECPGFHHPIGALAFLDEPDVIAREALEGSLKRARSQAATVPVLERIKSCEEFVRRAQ